MMTLRHVRFQISDLIQALEVYGKAHRPSISEALDAYYVWALGRGWKLVSMAASVLPNRIWVSAGERSCQLEIQERDMLYDLVWTSENALSADTPDYLEVYPVAHFAGRVVEVLMDRGWEMHPREDGFMKPGRFKPIFGREIYEAVCGLRAESDDLDAVIEGIADSLELP